MTRRGICRARVNDSRKRSVSSVEAVAWGIRGAFAGHFWGICGAFAGHLLLFGAFADIWHFVVVMSGYTEWKHF